MIQEYEFGEPRPFLCKMTAEQIRELSIIRCDICGCRLRDKTCSVCDVCLREKVVADKE